MINSTKITGTKYCIFRIGEKKFKDIKSIKGFEGHMQRTFNTPNADKNRKNENKILIGSENITKDVENYIQGIKLRKNGVLARELLLTASPEFFKERNTKDINDWVDLNIKFLKDNFGTNIIYAVLHKDEMTPHIHCLLVPRFKDEHRYRYKLSNNIYFDGPAKLSEWQDKYANCITAEYKDLKRGTKGSKAKHIKIKQYYTLVNANLNDKDLQSTISKAKNSILLEKKIKALQDTLKLYTEKCIDKENKLNLSTFKLEEINNKLDELQKDKEIYKETIKALSETYYISQESIKNIVKNIQKGVEKEREMGK